MERSVIVSPDPEKPRHLEELPPSSLDGQPEGLLDDASAPHYLPNGRLAIFAISMGVLWAAHVSNDDSATVYATGSEMLADDSPLDTSRSRSTSP